jgi:hypothetical protein
MCVCVYIVDESTYPQVNKWLVNKWPKLNGGVLLAQRLTLCVRAEIRAHLQYLTVAIG